MGQLVSPGIEEYIEAHTSGLPPVLHELERYTRLHHLMPQMLSGTVQGTFLHLFCCAAGVRNVLEIGTYTGYTAICMALAMPENGRLVTIDCNEETTHTAGEFIRKAGQQEKIDLRIGDAAAIIPTLKAVEFDLVFIDADKDSYCQYYDLVFDKVRKGGWILADNVLWSGKVTDPGPDAQTLAIKRYNDKVQADERVKNVIVSIRDGILMAQKIN